MFKLNNIHPGEILLEEFLKPMNISQNLLARKIDVSPRRINEIVLGKRSITAATDLFLSRVLGTSEGFWLGLQADYDLEEKKVDVGGWGDVEAAKEIVAKCIDRFRSSDVPFQEVSIR